MYQFDKLNLLHTYIPKYKDYLQIVPPLTLTKYATTLPTDLVLMNFHTISKSIDPKAPNSKEYKQMWRVTNSRVNKLVKHKVPGMLAAENVLRFEDLSQGQAVDLLECYAYSKRGSTHSLLSLLNLVSSQLKIRTI